VRVNDAQVTLQGYRDASISGSCFDKVNVNHISLLSCATVVLIIQTSDSKTQHKAVSITIFVVK
jgi:hypothetical protein